jgi:hypothetical protein
MFINESDRTPEYFGVIAKRQGLTIQHNPYTKQDGRSADWLEGFHSGELVSDKKKQQPLVAEKKA